MDGRRKKTTAPTLAFTCKQLHAECMKLYYKHTTFRIHSDWIALEWLTSLPNEYRRALKSVEIEKKWQRKSKLPGLRKGLAVCNVTLEEGVLRDWSRPRLGPRPGHDAFFRFRLLGTGITTK